MQYTLNPFTLVAEQHAQYHFIGAGAESIRHYTFSDRQKQLIDTLAAGEFRTEEELRDILGVSVVGEMVQQGWLIDRAPDTTSMDSRTTAFYRQYGMQGTESVLREKSVLILGCGGIGTHMAWHMTLLGVGKLTLVDFDTVEESNLNRQLLYDRQDIGRDKATVLREKLLQLRPEAEIRTVHLRISSQAELEALCTGERYDLLIKALDTPAAFPGWLDAVCKKHRLTYTTGITLQDRVLIGPTFLPGVSETGLSDILAAQPTAERKHGASPSMGLLLYRISDALAAECFKLLSGKGTLRYTGRIVAENIFTNETEILDENHAPPARRVHAADGSLAVDLLGIGLLCLGGMLRTELFALALLFGIVAPLLFYRSAPLSSVRATCINTLITGVLFLLRFARVIAALSAVGILVLLAGVFCAISLAALLSCGISALLAKHFEREEGKLC